MDPLLVEQSQGTVLIYEEGSKRATTPRRTLLSPGVASIIIITDKLWPSINALCVTSPYVRYVFVEPI